MSIDQFRISTPESPSSKGILWRSSIGSYLENLQRKGGFKGFNQHAASIIIAETDPRKQQAQSGRSRTPFVRTRRPHGATSSFRESETDRGGVAHSSKSHTMLHAN